MAFEVATPVYDGPFDLLLHLILKEEVDIHEVSLTRIVEAYLEEIQRMQMLDLDVATEFLLIASTLVELKTRRLLPGKQDMDLDEELALWSERDLLLARLLDCKTFKDVASVFTQLAEQASLSYPRRSGPDERFADLMPDMLEGVTAVRLQRAYLRATQPKPPTAIDWYHVAPIRASVADALMEMLETLPKLGKVTFKQITEVIHDRIEVVVRFLAILELFKQGRISLEQTDRFGDIEVMWTAGDDTGFVSVMQIDDYEG
ncbi:MAG: segregation/condensation protein A [Actinomycetota bacterium]|jgi:segregation and condensation protein A|nr:segregation/condensation protein A [Actinomycetota bacterium]